MNQRTLAIAILSFLTVQPVAFAAEKPPKITFDPYQQRTAIVGHLHQHNAFFDLNKWDYWLSAVVDRGVPRNPVLLFSTDTPDWFFFSKAFDIDGNELRVISGGRDVQIGSVHELVGVEFTPKYLEDHANTGISLKLSGDRGATTLMVPAEMISAFYPAYAREVEKAGGFRNDLIAANAAIAPTATQMAQAANASAAQAAARGGIGITFAVIPQGIYLNAVAAGSRADRGRLKPGQLVTAINGNSLAGKDQQTVIAIIKALNGPTSFSIAGLGDVTVGP